MCDNGCAMPFSTDAANLNKGYPNGTYAEREEIIKKHKSYVAGLIHFLATDKSVPSNI